MTQPIIVFDEFTRAFGAVRAVDRLTLEVPSGIIFGFLGPNGAGKTTTIRSLLGLLRPTAGLIEALSFDAAREADRVRERTGALLENPGLYEHMSAEDNLEFYGRVYRIPQPERSGRIRELLIAAGLWERRRELAKNWSKGMRQKLALARAIMHRPPLVLLDEPTSGLDVQAAVAVRDSLARLVAEGGTTIFLTTHNMAEAERLCARIAIIRRGRLVACGTPQELRERAGAGTLEIAARNFSESVVAELRIQDGIHGIAVANGHMTIQLDAAVETPGIVAWLVGAGVEIEEVHRADASLEDAFLSLVDEPGEEAAEPERAETETSHV